MVENIVRYKQDSVNCIQTISESIDVLNPDLGITLKRAPDYLTALHAYRMPGLRSDVASRELLAELSQYEQGRYATWMPLVAMGIPFETIDHLYPSGLEGKCSNQGKLESKSLFERAHASITSPDREKSLVQFLKQLEKVYINMEILYGNFLESTDEYQYSSHNPFHQKMLEVYVSTRDPVLFNPIFSGLFSYLEKVARDTMKRYHLTDSASAEFDDYYMAGTSRSMEVLPRFEAWRAIVTTFLSRHVSGAVLDEARTLDILSRDDRKKVSQYHAMIENTRTRLGHEPTQFELIDSMGLTPRDFHELLLLKETMHTLSLDSQQGDSHSDDKPTTLLDTVAAMDPMEEYMVLTPENEFMRRERQELLGKALAQLNENDRMVIHAYDVLGMTLKEIGETGYLGTVYCESRISQMHTKALERIKRKMIAMDGNI